jgi:hypothetical protein
MAAEYVRSCILMYFAALLRWGWKAVCDVAVENVWSCVIMIAIVTRSSVCVWVGACVLVCAMLSLLGAPCVCLCVLARYKCKDYAWL